MILEHFNKAAVNYKHLSACARSVAKQTGCQSTQKRGMPGKNAHIAALAGDFRFRHLFVHQQAFRRGNLQLESICHLDELPVHLLGRFEDFLDRALHVECLLGQIVVLTVNNLLEAANRVFQLDVLAGAAGELFRNVEGLR